MRTAHILNLEIEKERENEMVDNSFVATSVNSEPWLKNGCLMLEVHC